MNSYSLGCLDMNLYDLLRACHLTPCANGLTIRTSYWNVTRYTDIEKGSKKHLSDFNSRESYKKHIVHVFEISYTACILQWWLLKNLHSCTKWSNVASKTRKNPLYPRRSRIFMHDMHAEFHIKRILYKCKSFLKDRE